MNRYYFLGAILLAALAVVCLGSFNNNKSYTDLDSAVIKENSSIDDTIDSTPVVANSELDYLDQDLNQLITTKPYGWEQRSWQLIYDYNKIWQDQLNTDFNLNLEFTELKVRCHKIISTGSGDNSTFDTQKHL